jgi:hypothetical protein
MRRSQTENVLLLSSVCLSTRILDPDAGTGKWQAKHQKGQTSVFFFCKKRSKKTFLHDIDLVARQGFKIKSFLVLFFKKEYACLPAFGRSSEQSKKAFSCKSLN